MLTTSQWRISAKVGSGRLGASGSWGSVLIKSCAYSWFVSGINTVSSMRTYRPWWECRRKWSRSAIEPWRVGWLLARVSIRCPCPPPLHSHRLSAHNNLKEGDLIESKLNWKAKKKKDVTAISWVGALSMTSGTIPFSSKASWTDCWPETTWTVVQQRINRNAERNAAILAILSRELRLYWFLCYLGEAWRRPDIKSERILFYLFLYRCGAADPYRIERRHSNWLWSSLYAVYIRCDRLSSQRLYAEGVTPCPCVIHSPFVSNAIPCQCQAAGRKGRRARKDLIPASFVVVVVVSLGRKSF